MKFKRNYCSIVFIFLLFVLVLVKFEKHVNTSKGTLSITSFVHRNDRIKEVKDLQVLQNKKNWTILMTVNDGYFDFFQNWLHFYNKLKLYYPLIVVAEDETVFKKLQELDINIVFNVVRSWRNSLSHAAVSFGTKEFNKLVSGRPIYILRYLEKGMNILYVDLDTVWLQDPFPFFKGNFDMWMQLDGDRIDKNLCTGFIAAKSNNLTIQLMKLWETILNDHPANDQPAFNKAYKLSKVKLKPLDRNLFPSGNLYFQQLSDVLRNRVVVVHNNFRKGHDLKINRFKKFKLWFTV